MPERLAAGLAAIAVMVVWPVLIRPLVRPRVSFVLPLGAIDDLVQLPAIQPDAAAAGAIVNLYAMPLGHGQVYTAMGALHKSPLVRAKVFSPLVPERRLETKADFQIPNGSAPANVVPLRNPGPIDYDPGMRPKTLILRTAGVNCDQETAYAFERAGARSEFLHVNRVLERPELLNDYQLLAFPGGFSYGDDIAAGRIFANQVRHHLAEAFDRFIEAGKPIIGICNGFQVLVKTDLLPGALAGRTGQTATLGHNDCGRFVDRWVNLASRGGKCIWTAGIEHLELPVAHGEGKFIPADEAVRRALWDNGQVALVYAKADGSPAGGQFPDNPNASVDDIAGVCDASGLVFGLMPHPERHVDPTQHPAWTRRRPLPAEGQGLQIFRNAVRHVAAGVGAGV